MTTEEILDRAVQEKSFPCPAEESINQGLSAMAASLLSHSEAILKANAEDCAAARGKLPEVMLDRLYLDDRRLYAMAEGIQAIAALPSPVNRVLLTRRTENGLTIRRVAVPFGVLAVIYEARPNVTSDAAALALKSGNVAVLRCGREAWNSAWAIVEALRMGLKTAGLHEDRLQLVEDRSHSSAETLMKARGKVDLLIPRGGRNLIQTCVVNATVPVIETGTGICHIYVDQGADLNMALKIVENAKCSRPSVCNAEEVLLVHEAEAAAFLPRLQELLVVARRHAGQVPVELRLDPRAAGYISGSLAGPEDFDTEFLDYILAVKVVSSLDEAIAHINAHSTHHSEAIVTNTPEHAERFLHEIDSACVYVNASTRFTDGGCFGMGCEMGISTQKLHARGPMGLEELCTYKYEITGSGQIR